MNRFRDTGAQKGETVAREAAQGAFEMPISPTGEGALAARETAPAVAGEKVSRSAEVSARDTGQIIGSLRPTGPRLPRVLVPVQLDVLLVRAEGGDWADCRMRDPVQNPPPDQPNDAEHLLPDPFKTLTDDLRHLRRPRGAHLHWAIPDSLTASQSLSASDSTPSASPTFPSVPDRWLVLRISPSSSPARRAVKGWVLEADREPPVATPLEHWNEPGPADTGGGPLTALGRGDPAWAAYYDNVVTYDAADPNKTTGRFGFYDNLTDVAQGPISYLVCGWYADNTKDPLGASTITSYSSFADALKSLGWELADDEFSVAGFERPPIDDQLISGQALGGGEALPPAGPDDLPAREPDSGSYWSDGSWWPTQTLFHGAAVGLGWPDDNGAGVAQVTGGPPAASALTVALGGTLPESFASLVVNASGDPKLGPMLEAFHLGILREYDQPDGSAQLDATLHASRFSGRPGGFVTETITQSVPHYPQGGDSGLQRGVKGMIDLHAGDSAKTGAVEQAVAGGMTSVQQMGPLGAVERSPARQSFDVSAGTGTASRHAVESAGAGAPTSSSKSMRAEEQFKASTGAEQVIKGNLGSILGGVLTGGGPVTYTQEQVQVKRALPRYFLPQDLVILIQGGARTFKHGSDGIYSETGQLICRLSGFCVESVSARSAANANTYLTIAGSDLLEHGVDNVSVPEDCEDLLRETVLLDPGAAQAAASGAFVKASPAARATVNMAQLTQNFAVEQTAWWAIRDPRVDQTRLLQQSGIKGMLPSPVGLTPPVRPWLPRHVDWEVEYLPSAHEAHDWDLGEIDFAPDTAGIPGPDAHSDIVLAGRTLLTGGAATSLAGAVKKALDDANNAGSATLVSAGSSSNAKPDGPIRYGHKHIKEAVESAAADASQASGNAIPSDDRSGLQDIITTLAQMDVLSGALDHLHTKLRGMLAARGRPDADLESGFLRIRRLRLVDGYGQFLDLAGSNATTSADSSQILKAGPLAIDGRPDLVALPPRFTDRTRLWLRFTDKSAGPQVPGDLNSVDVTPLCGFVMPNHLDGTLDFYGPDGQTLGKVRPDYTAVAAAATPHIVWEDAPGRPSGVGQPPSRAMADLSSPSLGALADSLLAWGRTPQGGGQDHVVSALLRVIDSTRWTVDPFSHAGEEHLSLLVGHPVAVLRARLRLEVVDDAGQPSPITNAVPVRLGALTHWQDGLFGYFANDDYTTLYCVDAAAASFARPIGPMQGFLGPIADMDQVFDALSSDLHPEDLSVPADPQSAVTHPYVNTSGWLWIQPNQDVWLTLLVEPHTTIHATTGLLPRKDAAMRREWVTAGLAKLAPTFRFGPLLVEPQKVKMPIPTDLQGTWTWDHRTDINTWNNDPVANSTGDALIPVDPPAAHEGWLQLNPPAPKDAGTGGGQTG
jgi:hypothetical protein